MNPGPQQEGPKQRGLRTRAVHAGEPRPPLEDAVVQPIFQSSTYLLTGDESYHDIRYLRLSNNPNQKAVAAKLADLEGTEAAVVTASGMAAITCALLTFVKQGDHVIAQDCLYGGTLEFLREIAPGLGIETTFVSLEEPGVWEEARRPSSRVFYVESTTNPLMEVGRLDEVAAFARRQGLISMIDNTFATPINFRPREMGYDIVLHSATKYLNGHTDLVAGVVAGSREHVLSMRETLNITGGSLDPHPCFLLGRGLKTLPLRLAAQNESALALARALDDHPAVARVRYPGLPQDPSHQRAERWFAGFGAMLSFTPRGGVSARDRLLKRLQIPLVAPSLGGVETLVSCPATSSHAGLPPQARRDLGIEDELVRVSVGIEDAEDLIADFMHALE